MGVTFDEWGIDGARLVAGNAVDALRNGARIAIHTTVERVLRRIHAETTSDALPKASTRRRLIRRAPSGNETITRGTRAR